MTPSLLHRGANPNVTRRHSPDHGFTLIELLVVISIVALLIAILLPALGAGREAARGMQCLSNQRQVALGMYAYQADNKQYFPIYYYSGSAPTSPYFGTGMNTTNWANALEKFGFLNNAAKVLTCPSFTEGTPLPTPAPTETDKTNLNRTNYGYNFRHIGSSHRYIVTADWQYIPARADQLARASETYLLMDSVRDYAARITWGSYVVVDVVESGFLPRSRHSGNRSMLNMVWADGHGSVLQIADPTQPFIELGQYAAGTDNYWDRN